MDLTTLLAQPVSISRAKLWKVVMKCKHTFLRLRHFFSPSTYFIFFIGSTYLEHSCFWWNIFFLDATIAMTTENPSQRCIFYFTAKYPDPNTDNEIKMRQKTLFWIFANIPHVLEWIWFVFLHPLMTSLDILC